MATKGGLLKEYEIRIKTNIEKAEKEVKELGQALTRDLGQAALPADLTASINEAIASMTKLSTEGRAAFEALQASMSSFKPQELEAKMKETSDKVAADTEKITTKFNEMMAAINTSDTGRFTQFLAEMTQPIKELNITIQNLTTTLKGLSGTTIAIPGKDGIKKSVDEIDAAIDAIVDRMTSIKGDLDGIDLDLFKDDKKAADVNIEKLREQTVILDELIALYRRAKDLTPGGGKTAFALAEMPAMFEEYEQYLRAAKEQLEIGSTKKKAITTEVRLNLTFDANKDIDDAKVEEYLKVVQEKVVGRIQEAVAAKPIKLRFGWEAKATEEEKAAAGGIKAAEKLMKGKDVDVLYKTLKLRLEGDQNSLKSSIEGIVESLQREIEHDEHFQIKLAVVPGDIAVNELFEQVKKKNEEIKTTGGGTSYDGRFQMVGTEGLARDETVAQIRDILASHFGDGGSGGSGGSTPPPSSPASLNKTLENANNIYDKVDAFREEGHKLNFLLMSRNAEINGQIESDAKTIQMLNDRVAYRNYVEEEILEEAKKSVRGKNPKGIETSRLYNDALETADGKKYTPYAYDSNGQFTVVELEDWQRMLRDLGTSGEGSKAYTNFFKDLNKYNAAERKPILEALKPFGVEWAKDKTTKKWGILAEDQSLTSTKNVAKQLESVFQGAVAPYVENARIASARVANLKEEQDLARDILGLSERSKNFSGRDVLENENRFRQIAARTFREEGDTDEAKARSRAANAELYAKYFREQNELLAQPVKDLPRINELQTLMEGLFEDIPDVIAHAQKRLKVGTDGFTEIEKEIQAAEEDERKAIRAANQAKNFIVKEGRIQNPELQQLEKYNGSHYSPILSGLDISSRVLGQKTHINPADLNKYLSKAITKGQLLPFEDMNIVDYLGDEKKALKDKELIATKGLRNAILDRVLEIAPDVLFGKGANANKGYTGLLPSERKARNRWSPEIKAAKNREKLRDQWTGVKKTEEEKAADEAQIKNITNTTLAGDLKTRVIQQYSKIHGNAIEALAKMSDEDYQEFKSTFEEAAATISGQDARKAARDQAIALNQDLTETTRASYNENIKSMLDPKKAVKDRIKAFEDNKDIKEDLEFLSAPESYVLQESLESADINRDNVLRRWASLKDSIQKPAEASAKGLRAIEEIKNFASQLGIDIEQEFVDESFQSGILDKIKSIYKEQTGDTLDTYKHGSIKQIEEHFMQKRQEVLASLAQTSEEDRALFETYEADLVDADRRYAQAFLRDGHKANRTAKKTIQVENEEYIPEENLKAAQEYVEKAGLDTTLNTGFRRIGEILVEGTSLAVDEILNDTKSLESLAKDVSTGDSAIPKENYAKALEYAKSVGIKTSDILRNVPESFMDQMSKVAQILTKGTKVKADDVVAGTSFDAIASKYANMSPTRDKVVSQIFEDRMRVFEEAAFGMKYGFDDSIINLVKRFPEVEESRAKYAEINAKAEEEAAAAQSKRVQAIKSGEAAEKKEAASIKERIAEKDREIASQQKVYEAATERADNSALNVASSRARQSIFSSALLDTNVEDEKQWLTYAGADLMAAENLPTSDEIYSKIEQFRSTKSDLLNLIKEFRELDAARQEAQNKLDEASKKVFKGRGAVSESDTIVKINGQEYRESMLEAYDSLEAIEKEIGTTKDKYIAVNGKYYRTDAGGTLINKQKEIDKEAAKYLKEFRDAQDDATKKLAASEAKKRELINKFGTDELLKKSGFSAEEILTGRMADLEEYLNDTLYKDFASLEKSAANDIMKTRLGEGAGPDDAAIKDILSENVTRYLTETYGEAVEYAEAGYNEAVENAEKELATLNKMGEARDLLISKQEQISASGVSEKVAEPFYDSIRNLGLGIKGEFEKLGIDARDTEGNFYPTNILKEKIKETITADVDALMEDRKKYQTEIARLQKESTDKIAAIPIDDTDKRAEILSYYDGLINAQKEMIAPIDEELADVDRRQNLISKVDRWEGLTRLLADRTALDKEINSGFVGAVDALSQYIVQSQEEISKSEKELLDSKSKEKTEQIQEKIIRIRKKMEDVNAVLERVGVELSGQNVYFDESTKRIFASADTAKSSGKYYVNTKKITDEQVEGYTRKVTSFYEDSTVPSAYKVNQQVLAELQKLRGADYKYQRGDIDWEREKMSEDAWKLKQASYYAGMTQAQADAVKALADYNKELRVCDKLTSEQIAKQTILQNKARDLGLTINKGGYAELEGFDKEDWMNNPMKYAKNSYVQALLSPTQGKLTPEFEQTIKSGAATEVTVGNILDSVNAIRGAVTGGGSKDRKLAPDVQAAKNVLDSKKFKTFAEFDDEAKAAAKAAILAGYNVYAKKREPNKGFYSVSGKMKDESSVYGSTKEIAKALGIDLSNIIKEVGAAATGASKKSNSKWQPAPPVIQEARKAFNRKHYKKLEDLSPEAIRAAKTAIENGYGLKINTKTKNKYGSQRGDIYLDKISSRGPTKITTEFAQKFGVELPKAAAQAGQAAGKAAGQEIQKTAEKKTQEKATRQMNLPAEEKKTAAAAKQKAAQEPLVYNKTDAKAALRSKVVGYSAETAGLFDTLGGFASKAITRAVNDAATQWKPTQGKKYQIPDEEVATYTETAFRNAVLQIGEELSAASKAGEPVAQNVKDAFTKLAGLVAVSAQAETEKALAEAANIKSGEPAKKKSATKAKGSSSVKTKTAKKAVEDLQKTGDQTVQATIDNTTKQAEQAKQEMQKLAGADSFAWSGVVTRDQLAELAKMLRAGQKIADEYFNERPIFANSKTGYITNPFIVGGPERITGETKRKVIASAEQKVDTGIHTHPVKRAALSVGDVKSAFGELKNGITKQIVLAAEDVMEIDFSKIKKSKKDEIINAVQVAKDTATSEVMPAMLEHFKNNQEEFVEIYKNAVNNLDLSNSEKKRVRGIAEDFKPELLQKLASSNTIEDVMSSINDYLTQAVKTGTGKDLDIGHAFEKAARPAFFEHVMPVMQEKLLGIFQNPDYLKKGVTSAIKVTPIDSFRFASKVPKYLGADESAKGVAKEGAAAADLAKMMLDAAAAKEAFVKANANLLASTGPSADGIKEEANAAAELQKELVKMESVDWDKISPDAQKTITKNFGDIVDIKKYANADKDGNATVKYRVIGKDTTGVVDEKGKLDSMSVMSVKAYTESLRNSKAAYKELDQTINQYNRDLIDAAKAGTDRLDEYRKNEGVAIRKHIEGMRNDPRYDEYRNSEADVKLAKGEIQAQKFARYAAIKPLLEDLERLQNDRGKGIGDESALRTAIKNKEQEIETALEQIKIDGDRLIKEDNRIRNEMAKSAANADKAIENRGNQQKIRDQKAAAEKAEKEANEQHAKAAEAALRPVMPLIAEYEGMATSIAHGVAGATEAELDKIGARVRTEIDGINTATGNAFKAEGEALLDRLQATKDKIPENTAKYNADIARREAETKAKQEENLKIAQQRDAVYGDILKKVDAVREVEYELARAGSDNVDALAKRDAARKEVTDAIAAVPAELKDVGRERSIMNQLDSAITAAADKYNAEVAKNYEKLIAGMPDYQRLSVENTLRLNEGVHPDKIVDDIAKVNEFETRLKAAAEAVEYFNLLRQKAQNGGSFVNPEDARRFDELTASVLDTTNAINQFIINPNGSAASIQNIFGLQEKLTSANGQAFIERAEGATGTLKEKLSTIANNAAKYTAQYIADVNTAIAALEHSIAELRNSGATNENIGRQMASELYARNILTGQSSLSNKAIDLGRVNSDLRKAYQYRNAYRGMPTDMYQKYSSIIDRYEDFRDNSSKYSYADLKAARAELEGLNADLEKSGRKTDGVFGTIGQRMKDMNAKFFATYLSMQSLVRYGRQIISTVTQLDSALTELRKVSGASDVRLAQSFEASKKTAVELGATVQDIIKITSDWSRLGETIDNAESLARVTALFQNVGDNMTADDSSSYLISTMKGFKIQAEEAERIVDVYNEVANNFAIDTRGIGEAIQRSAASFGASNTTMEEAVALVTTANSVVQNPETVGTAFKSMTARLRASKAEIEEIEGAEAGLVTTTANLQKYIKGITGFDILEKDGKTFKSTYEILLNIAKVFDQLDNTTQAALAEKLFGKRASNVGLAILRDPEQLERAYKMAMNSAGSAQRELEAYERSIQYSIGVLKANIEALSSDFLDSQLVKGVTDFFSMVIGGLDAIISKTGGLTALLPMFMATNSVRAAGGIQNILANARAGSLFKGEIITNKQYARGGEEIVAGSGQYYKAGELMSFDKRDATFFETTGGALVRNLGIGLIVTAATAFISSYATAIKEGQEAAKQGAEKIKESQANIEASIPNLSSLQTTLQSSTATEDQRIKAREKLQQIQDDLVAAYGKEAEALDVVQGKLDGHTASIDEQISKVKELYAEQYKQWMKEAHQGGLLGVGAKTNREIGEEALKKATSLKANNEAAAHAAGLQELPAPGFTVSYKDEIPLDLLFAIKEIEGVDWKKFAGIFTAGTEFTLDTDDPKERKRLLNEISEKITKYSQDNDLSDAEIAGLGNFQDIVNSSIKAIDDNILDRYDENAKSYAYGILAENDFESFLDMNDLMSSADDLTMALREGGDSTEEYGKFVTNREKIESLISTTESEIIKSALQYLLDGVMHQFDGNADYAAYSSGLIDRENEIFGNFEKYTDFGSVSGKYTEEQFRDAAVGDIPNGMLKEDADLVYAIAKAFEETGGNVDDLIRKLKQTKYTVGELKNEAENLSGISIVDGMTEAASGLDKISDVLEDLQNEDGKFDFTKIGTQSFTKAFEGVDTSAVEEFQKAVLASKGAMGDDVQNAANGLAKALIDLKLSTADVTAEDEDLIASMLETMNVTNAQEYATQYLNEQLADEVRSKYEAASASEVASGAAYESAAAALDEALAGNEDSAAYQNLRFAKLEAAITVGSAEQIAELANEAAAVGLLAASWRDLAAAKGYDAKLDEMAASGVDSGWIANAREKNNERLASLQNSNLEQIKSLQKTAAVAPSISRSGGGSSGGGGGGGGGSDKDKKDEKKEIDWMERMVNLLQKQHDLLKENADDEYQTYGKRIEATKELIKQDENLLNVYKQQSREYGVAYEKAYDEVRKLAENGQLKDLWDNDIYGLGASYEEIKKVNDEINATFEKYGKRNLDYNNRPYIKNDDGSWTTILTETAGFKAGEKEFSVVITPILENGDEIDLDAYIDQIQAGLDEKAANGEEISLDTLISLDPNNLIAVAAEGGMDVNGAAFEQMEAELQGLKDKATELRDANIDGVKSLRDAVENGALDISQFSQEVQEAIQNLMDKYDKVQESREKEKQTIKEIKDHQQEMYEMELNMIKERQKAIENERDIMQHSIDMRETTGSEIIKESDYEELIDNADELAENYREQLSVLQEQKGTLEEGSAAWYNVVSQIYEVDSALRDVEKQQAEWNEQIKQLPIRRIQRYLQMLENIKKDIQNYNAEMNTLGENPNQQSYTDMFEIDVEELDAYEKELNKLRENLKTYTYGTDKFEETANAIQECEDSVSSLIQEMREYNTAILNIPIEKINQLVEKLNNIKAAMEEVQEENNTVTEAAIEILGKQTEQLNKQIDEVNKKYDERRKILEEERDANKEQLALEKARLELEKARGQRTNKVLKQGEWTWQADQEAVKSAAETVRDAEYDKQLADLEKAREAELKPLEDEIERLDKLSEKWSEHRGNSELELATEKAIELTGAKDFRERVLAGTDDAIFNKIERSYNEMLHGIDQYTEQIKDYEQTSALMSTYISEYNKAIAEAEQIDDPVKRQKAMNDAADYYIRQMNAVQNQAKNGFTSQENLQSTLGAYKESSIESALANTVPAVQGLYSDFSSYMKIVSDQNITLDKNTATWKGIHESVQAQLEELKRLYEIEQQKLKERQARARSSGGGGSDRDEGDLNHGIYAVVGGASVEAAGGTNLGGKGGGSSYYEYRGSYDDLKEKGLIHHEGIKTGYVGHMNDDERLRALETMSTMDLKKDEVPSLLQEGEVVLNRDQQNQRLKNLVPLDSSDMLSQYTLGPDVLNLSAFRARKLKGGNYAGNSIQMQQNFNFGDIHVMEAQNVTDIARGIMNGGLSQALTQQLYKR